MNKENIPDYTVTPCCRTCKYWSERMNDNYEDTDWQSVCRKYNCDTEDYYICNSFEKSKRDFGNE